MEKSWLDAIIRVLREEGVPMHYKDIARVILENGYYHTSGKTPENSVNRFLNENKNLFEKDAEGRWMLVGTPLAALHTPTAGLTVGRATPVVVRPSTVYDPYKKHASDFIDSKGLSVLSYEEKELLELIVNFRLPLVEEDVCFADILDDMEKVEFSPEEKIRPQSIDIDADQLRRKHDGLRKQIGNNAQSDSKLKEVCSMLRNYIGSANNEGKVDVPIRPLGEFIPGDKPKVVIYYNNIKSILRWPVMAGVFVHEMFHAWNYSKAKETSLFLAIDEPMVEFETLYFLKELAAFTSSQSHSLKGKVERVYEDGKDLVQNKQWSIGDVAAYGFGYYLFDKLSGVDSIDWIETYSVKSAFIKGRDSRVGKATKALIPVYPFTSEADVMKLFRKIIFDGRVPFLTAGNAVKTGSDVSLRKLVLACIEIIGRKYFEAKELYAFAPIFKLCAAVPGNLEDALKKQLDELVKDGVLEVLSDGYYSMKLAGVEDKPISKVKTPAKSKSGTKAKSIPFAVKFPDDDVEFNEGTAVERFIKSLKHIGLSRVQSLGIMRNGYNLVSDVEHPDNRGKSLQHNEDDKYIITKLGNGDKKGYLYQIANRLGINIKIYDTII